jgi:hypothetical protein
MITKLVTDDNNNSFKLPYAIYLEDINYMTILTIQERERLVLELYYNQGKTYREISKEARISPRDIGVILNKVVEEKKTEEINQDNIDSEKNQTQKQHLSLSAQAYKLFSDRKDCIRSSYCIKPQRVRSKQILQRILEAKTTTQSEYGL